MPLREDLESNESGLIDKSLLDENLSLKCSKCDAEFFANWVTIQHERKCEGPRETPVYCKKKHTHDKRCMQ